MSEQLTYEQLLAKVQELESKATHVKAGNSISLRVSTKGAVSVYGLGRFPVTLYKGQMERLIEAIPSIQAFMADNASQLAVKPVKE